MSCNRCSECVLCGVVCSAPFFSFLHVHSFVLLHCSPDLFRCFLFMPRFCDREQARRERLRGIKLVLNPDQEADGVEASIVVC